MIDYAFFILFHYFAWGWKEKWGLEKQEKERSPLWRLGHFLTSSEEASFPDVPCTLVAGRELLDEREPFAADLQSLARGPLGPIVVGVGREEDCRAPSTRADSLEMYLEDSGFY